MGPDLSSRSVDLISLPFSWGTFFCSTRTASILPSRPQIAFAVARSGGQGRRFFSAAEGLSLTGASTAARYR